MKYKCQVPSGSGRFILQVMRPASARLKRSSASAPRAREQVRRLELPGTRAEGLALDGFGRAFVADDAGGVLRVEP